MQYSSIGGAQVHLIWASYHGGPVCKGKGLVARMLCETPGAFLEEHPNLTSKQFYTVIYGSKNVKEIMLDGFKDSWNSFSISWKR